MCDFVTKDIFITFSRIADSEVLYDELELLELDEKKIDSFREKFIDDVFGIFTNFEQEVWV
jgi:hypothetical protein